MRKIVYILLLPICLGMIGVICTSKTIVFAQVPSEETPSSLNRKDFYNVEQLIFQAETAKSNAKYAEAEQIWLKIIQLQPDAVWAKYRLASLLSLQSKRNKANKIYREMIQSSPEDAEAYYALGGNLMDQSLSIKSSDPTAETYVRQAIEVYNDAIELRPEDILRLHWRSQIPREKIVSMVRQKIQSKSDRTAIDYLLIWSVLRALRVDIEVTSMHQNSQGLCLAIPEFCRERDKRKRDPKQEIDALRQAIRLEPKLAILYKMLGASFYEQEKYDESISALKQGIELSPESARAYYHLGKALVSQNNFDEATEVFYKAVQAEPHNSWLDFQAWFVPMIAAKQPNEKVIQVLVDELNQRPNPLGYYILGNLLAVELSNSNRLETAIIAYQNAVKLDPEFAKAYEQLGLVLETQNRIEAAKKAYKNAINYNPLLNTAYRNLRAVLRTQGKFNEAFQIFLDEQAAME